MNTVEWTCPFCNCENEDLETTLFPLCAECDEVFDAVDVYPEPVIYVAKEYTRE